MSAHAVQSYVSTRAIIGGQHCTLRRRALRCDYGSAVTMSTAMEQNGAVRAFICDRRGFVTLFSVSCFAAAQPCGFEVN